MTLREKQAEFASMIGKLFKKADELNSPIVILELYRSLETQKAYVVRGVSRTLKSKHLDGLAIDIAFLKDIMDDGQINFKSDEYTHLGLFWESIGGRWGGRFGDNLATPVIEGWDAGHFEYKE